MKAESAASRDTLRGTPLPRACEPLTLAKHSGSRARRRLPAFISHKVLRFSNNKKRAGLLSSPAEKPTRSTHLRFSSRFGSGKAAPAEINSDCGDRRRAANFRGSPLWSENFRRRENRKVSDSDNTHPASSRRISRRTAARRTLARSCRCVSLMSSSFSSEADLPHS